MNSKINNHYKIKSQSLEVKDVDTSSRKVSFYLSHFGNVDSDNDLLVKGCFKKSLQERGVDSSSNRKIAYLRYHNWEMPIGKFVELQEDDFGLYAVGELGNSTLGNDALLDYQDGIIREHSIGFRYIQDKIKWIEDLSIESKGYFMVSEVALWEGSAVTFGANEMTPVLEVAKSEDKDDFFKKINDEINTICKSLVNGKGTDERLYSLEMRMKYLTSQLTEIAQLNIDNPKAIVIEEKGFDWNNVITNIK
jgi:HK97 family phage prohead protease